MINIYTVLMCAFLAAFFYYQEGVSMQTAYEWAGVRGNNSKESQYFRISAVRYLWLARVFLISSIVLAVTETLLYVEEPY